MDFKYNVFTKNYEHHEKIKDFKFRFVNKKSSYIGLDIIFFSGSNIEVYNDLNNNVKKDIYGIAHFVEHLLFTKNKKKLNMLQELTRKKLNFNGGTAPNTTFYYIYDTSSDFINKTMKILQEIAFTLDVSFEDVEKEHGIISTEASLSSDSVYTKLVEKRSKYLPTCSLDHVVIGDVNSICSITLEDAINFYKTAYSKQNCEIVFYGDFEQNLSLKDQVLNKFFENMENLEQEYEIVISNNSNLRTPSYPKKLNFKNNFEHIVTPKATNPIMYRQYCVNYSDFKQYQIPKFSKFNIEKSFNLLNATLFEKIKQRYNENGVDYSKISIEASDYKEHNIGIDFVITYNGIEKNEYEHALKVLKSVLKDFNKLVTKKDFESYIKYLQMQEKKQSDKVLSDLVSTTARNIMANIALFTPQEMLTIDEKKYLDIFNYEEFVDFITNLNIDENYLEFKITNN